MTRLLIALLLVAPAYAGDGARWLEVTGRLTRCGSIACLRARKVALATPLP